MKTIRIPLPKIEGVELKNATVDLEKGVVIAEYGEEEAPFEAKKGDFLTLKTDSSKVVIFEAMAGVFGGVDTFTIMYDLPMRINGEMAYTPIDRVKFPFNNFRHSTEEEKALMIEEMEKLGKRYNPKTFRIEDIGSIKTFKDLDFKMHPIFLDAKSQGAKSFYSNSKHAVMEFENGYGVSVIFGEQFYSNGIDNYEVAVLKDGLLCHETYITDYVVAYQTEDEVTEIMRKVQEFNK